MPATLDSLDLKLDAILARLAEQVPEGPVVTIPAPSTGQTTAWAACYDEHGVPESGVIIEVKLHSQGTATKHAWDAKTHCATSNAQGIASILIPRNAGLRFAVRRNRGQWVIFSGADQATLELPAIVGT